MRQPPFEVGLKEIWLILSLVDSFRNEAVADPGFGLYVLLASFSLEFLAELPNEDAEILRLVGRLGAPNGSEQSAVSYDLSGMAGEMQQQIELLGGEMNWSAKDGDGMRIRIDNEISGFDC